MSLLNSFLKGYTSAQTPHADEKKRKWQFEELSATPFLFSSGYLNEVYEEANNKQEYETILDHLYRHQATEVESYAELEKKIIDKYWR